MRDAEANIWSVSLKASHALLPFFELIDEQFINYMLGPAKYNWYYNLAKKPIKLVAKNHKAAFYKALQKKTHRFAYAKPFTDKILQRFKMVFIPNK